MTSRVLLGAEGQGIMAKQVTPSSPLFPAGLSKPRADVVLVAIGEAAVKTLLLLCLIILM